MGALFFIGVDIGVDFEGVDDLVGVTLVAVEFVLGVEFDAGLAEADDVVLGFALDDEDEVAEGGVDVAEDLEYNRGAGGLVMGEEVEPRGVEPGAGLGVDTAGLGVDIGALGEEIVFDGEGDEADDLTTVEAGVLGVEADALVVETDAFGVETDVLGVEAVALGVETDVLGVEAVVLVGVEADVEALGVEAEGLGVEEGVERVAVVLTVACLGVVDVGFGFVASVRGVF